MNTQKHTRGQWNVCEITPSKGTSYPGVIVGIHGNLICSCSNGTREETEAKAKLIAAAPDMLIALQNIIKDVSPRINRLPARDVFTELLSLNEGIKAIRKATEQ